MKIADFFHDLKVIELASVLAGPAVGMFFSELGAQVTKVENKRAGGDVTRQWKLPSESKEDPVSAYYCSVNWRKKVLQLDLSQLEDREQIYELVKDADIVISNFKPGSAARIGMDAARLRSLNPRLIYAELSAFGEASKRPAFDIVLQAEAGFLYMTGEPGRPPVRMPVALIDLLAAHQLKEAILLALLQRERTGEGSVVRTSLLAAAIASLANQATNWLMAGHIPQPMGTQHPNIAPYGDVFYTKDEKPLTLAVGNDKQFAALCHCLEADKLQEDEQFKTNILRVRHRVALEAALTPLIRQFEREVLQQRFQANGVPAGSIFDMSEVFSSPLAQSMILEEEIEGVATRRVSTVAFDMIMQANGHDE